MTRKLFLFMFNELSLTQILSVPDARQVVPPFEKTAEPWIELGKTIGHRATTNYSWPACCQTSWITISDARKKLGRVTIT